MAVFKSKNISTKDLIKRIALKDQNALTILYENTSNSVYGFALSIVKDHHIAEDIMQDTYIKIYNNASSYKDDGKLMSWILTIVRNLCLMRLRENKYKGSLTNEEMLNIEDTKNVYKESDNKMILELCLNTLNDDERQIVVLYAITGLKHKEIAELLNIPLSTVLSKYNRALKKIKKTCGGECND